MKPYSVLAVVMLAAASAVAESSTSPATVPSTPSSTAAPVGDAFVQQATPFVKAMRFVDADKTERVTKLVADYLRQLRQVIDAREAQLAKLGEDSNAAEVNQQQSNAWLVCRNSSVALRDALTVQLNALMTPYQVERIKDGITEDWYPRTVQLYDEMIPAMTYPQRAHIAGLLTEMRENAMLELGTGPQEKWVAKYRGIVNNYLAAQGHDFSSLAKAYDEKRKAKQKQ